MCLWKAEYIKNLLMQSHSYFHLPATLLMILTVLTLAKSVSIYKWNAKINCIWLQYIALRKKASFQLLGALYIPSIYKTGSQSYFSLISLITNTQRRSKQHTNTSWSTNTFHVCFSRRKSSAYSMTCYSRAALVVSVAVIISYNNKVTTFTADQH